MPLVTDASGDEVVTPLSHMVRHDRFGRLYHLATIDRLDVFYREANDRLKPDSAAPALLSVAFAAI
ncbi:hypothetical protein GCM10023114_40410 [Mycolicibacterium sediminis]|uniref:Uncharacterized protein n=1 Tax=Mycolicibacterium sediminis TaxID=1286180 RepID=A0A7I7QVM0_9MYCO|nr:hypothetical protein MSEDJ_44500 [Mycolicibacterium sediminis]